MCLFVIFCKILNEHILRNIQKWAEIIHMVFSLGADGGLILFAG